MLKKIANESRPENVCLREMQEPFMFNSFVLLDITMAFTLNIIGFVYDACRVMLQIVASL
jgi:hypothetical protein